MNHVLTTNRIARFLFLSTLALTPVSAGLGCGGPSTSADAGVDPLASRKRAVLVALMRDVIHPTYQSFRSRAQALATATIAYDLSQGSSERMAAQQAWRAAMSVWQEAELMQLGPAGMMGTVSGGQDLRDEIYSWPTTNLCRIDQETVAEGYADPATLAATLVNVRGLDAMEYLLFSEGADNNCSELSPINTDGTWAALTPTELQSRRAAYANALAGLVLLSSQELVDAWDPESGLFAAALADAGQGSEHFVTAQAALNALTDAMFYLDKETKDSKIGTPAGISTCLEPTCLESLESQHAQASREHALANLRAFSRLYHGGEATGTELGLDDLLVDAGATTVAEEMSAALTSALSAFEGLEGSLKESIEVRPATVQAAYDALAEVGRLLKGELIVALQLDLPDRAAGDAD